MTSTGVALEVYGPRGVIHEGAFLEHGQAIFGTVQKLDEFLLGIELVLARDPGRYGQAVRVQDGKTYFALKTIIARAWPSVLIIYSYDANHVTLYDIGRVSGGGGLRVSGHAPASSPSVMKSGIRDRE